MSDTTRGTAIGQLSIDAGLRPGVSRVAVLADLNGDVPTGQFGFDWRLVAQPTDSGATLADAQSAKPVFIPGSEGTYELSVAVHFQSDTARSTGSTTEQSVMVSARPDDPPIGVPIETLSAPPTPAIVIDGKPVTRNLSGELHFAVLDRTTRALVQSGDVLANASGVSQLVGIATKFSGKLGYLMVVSGYGVVPAALPGLVNFERMLGHDLTADEQGRVTAFLRVAFSIIGTPGAAANSAWSNVGYPGNLTEAHASGDITGYLQENPATNLYDFVSPEYPTFATAGPGSDATTNVIQVGSQSYSATLPSGATAGIHVLALDPYSLQPVQSSDPTFPNNQVWPTNTNAGTATDIRDQEMLSFALGILGESFYPGSLIVLQTVGTVRVMQGRLGRAVSELGGNQALFNSLATPGSYALVGRAISSRATVPIVPPVAESSTASLGQSGQLTGVLAPSRNDYSFAPLISDSPDAVGTMNTGLISVAYQPPQPFPAFTGGQAAAETYIGDQLRLCPVDAVTCDVRTAYYEHYRANWQQKALDLARMTYPGGEDFTPADFNAVKDQLGDEISDLNHVQTYLAALQQPFERSGTRAYVDLQAIGQQIQDSLNPPQRDASPTGNALLAFFVNVTKIYFDTIGQRPAKLMLDAVSAGLSLIAALNRPDGSPTLDGAIRATTRQLASAILDRFDAAQRALTTVGLLIVSDYGKLQTTATHVDSDWRLPADPSIAVNALRLATEQFYYQTLVPILDPMMIQIAPPPPTGPSNARNLTCWSTNIFGEKRKEQYFVREPDVAQDLQVFGFNGSGAPIQSVIFLLSRNGPYWSVPDAGILDRLFAPAGPGLSGLGFNKTQFYSASSPPPVNYQNPNLNWGRRLLATDTVDTTFKKDRCGLPDR